jgi:hypothetical protein
MPRCPDCASWSVDFDEGRYDADSIWYCLSCWKKFDDEERTERLKLGILLPEDRKIWYSPMTVLQCSDAASKSHNSTHQLSIITRDLKVDFIEDGISMTLKPRILPPSDFIVCPLPSSSSSSLSTPSDLSGISWIYAPHKILPDYRALQLKLFFELSREEKRISKSLETRARIKQQAESDQKKRELLDLALKRAEKKTTKKPGKNHLVKRKVDQWKLDNANDLNNISMRKGVPVDPPDFDIKILHRPPPPPQPVNDKIFAGIKRPYIPDNPSDASKRFRKLSN